MGNPFRPVEFEPATLPATVLSLAQAAYEERQAGSFELQCDRLAVLADALEETGDVERAIVDHLRSAGPHVRGCWALDVVLGKDRDEEEEDEAEE